MASPIFDLEILLGSRRGRLPFFRRLYTGWLLLLFAHLVVVHARQLYGLGDAPLSRAVVFFTQSFVVQHFALLLFAAPALFAGAVSDEKAQGTLPLLLATDLLPWEIVVGKLFGRLAQLAPLTLAGLPLLCFVSAFYGAPSLAAILGIVFVTATLLFALGSVCLWVSVGSRQTRNAGLLLYLGLIFGGTGVWAGLRYGLPFVTTLTGGSVRLDRTFVGTLDVIQCLNPLHVLEPGWTLGDPGEFLRRLRVVTVTHLVAGGAFLALAVLRLRPAAIRYLEGTVRRRTKAPSRAAMGDEPVRWKERTAGRRLPRWALAASILGGSVALSWWFVENQQPQGFLWQGGVAGMLASLVVGIRASGAVTGERERAKTWDSVLLTPMETWELLVDKRQGILEWSYPYFFAFFLPAMVFALPMGWEALCYSGAIAVLSWAAMYYMTCTGIWCSVSSRTSGRSLFATVGTGYGYCLVILIGIAFAYLWLACPIAVFLTVLACMGVTNITWEAAIVCFVLTCLFVSWRMIVRGDLKLWQAQSWIDAQERYGRTLTRSLARALRKHQERLDERQRERRESEVVAG